jgi:hypothetical protein
MPVADTDRNKKLADHNELRSNRFVKRSYYDECVPGFMAPEISEIVGKLATKKLEKIDSPVRT